MIIYDTKDNYNNQIKGMLYLSIIDVDYLVSKYTIDGLKRIISEDYVEVFKEELLLVSYYRKLSNQYYPVLTLGVENDKDEKLLSILAEEVKNGNMFTREQLRKIPQDEIEKRLSKFDVTEIDEMSFEDIYKLRSYQMSKYIYEEIEEANKYVKIMYEEQTDYGFRNAPKYKYAESNYKVINKNMESLGLSSDIYDSDYFEVSNIVARKLKLVRK